MNVPHLAAVDGTTLATIHAVVVRVCPGPDAADIASELLEILVTAGTGGAPLDTWARKTAKTIHDRERSRRRRANELAGKIRHAGTLGHRMNGDHIASGGDVEDAIIARLDAMADPWGELQRDYQARAEERFRGPDYGQREDYAWNEAWSAPVPDPPTRSRPASERSAFVHHWTRHDVMGLRQPYVLRPRDLAVVRLSAGRRPDVENPLDAYAAEYAAVRKTLQRWGSVPENHSSRDL